MCLGRTHALGGAVAGAGVGIAAHLPTPGLLVLAGLSAGFATLPDLDQVGSCAARSLGFASQGFAHVVRWVSGGHRHATHTAFAVAVMLFVTGTLSLAAVSFPATRWALGAVLALAVAAGLRALRLGGHFADVLALAVAGVMAGFGVDLAMVPVACAVGWSSHIVGDACTDKGVPVFWPFAQGHFRLLPEPFAFATGTRPERFVVVPLLWLALGWLAWHASGLPIPAVHL